MAGTGMEGAENRAESGGAGSEAGGETFSRPADSKPNRSSTALERYLWVRRMTPRQLAEKAQLSLRTIRDAVRGRMSARTRTMIYAALNGAPEELLPDYLEENF